MLMKLSMSRPSKIFKWIARALQQVKILRSTFVLLVVALQLLGYVSQFHYIKKGVP